MVTALPMFALCLMHAAELLPRARYRKVGGLHFLRIGRLQTSWSIAKSSPN